MKEKKQTSSQLKDVIRISSLPVFVASLCCVSPIVLFLAGLSSASFATSLADNLYDNYKWYFRGIGILLLGISVLYYLYQKKGICSIEQAKRKKNEIINTIALTFIGAVVGYVLFLYVIVHFIGVFLNLWQ